jgi:precorrin-2 dehydrogenase/sirohydrochlorin ferrochelatase
MVSPGSCFPVLLSGRDILFVVNATTEMVSNLFPGDGLPARAEAAPMGRSMVKNIREGEKDRSPYFYAVPTSVPMLPLILDLSGRRVVIFGGGPVGARKAAFFREECRVVVASRSFGKEVRGLDVERVKLDLGTASDQDLKELMEGAFLVIAAVQDPLLNNRILALSRELGIHCNSASGDPGDVIIPSVWKGRSHTVAVTTFGRSPAMARYIREKVALDADEIDRMIDLQGRAREALRAGEPSQEKRAAILREIVHDEAAWKALNRGVEAAWEYIEGRYLHG